MIPTRLDGTVPEWAQKRHDFAVRYCKEKGWAFDQLTIAQVMEIREQQEWKDTAKGDTR